MITRFERISVLSVFWSFNLSKGILVSNIAAAFIEEPCEPFGRLQASLKSLGFWLLTNLLNFEIVIN